LQQGQQQQQIQQKELLLCQLVQQATCSGTQQHAVFCLL
jgi:hypothetical protein